MEIIKVDGIEDAEQLKQHPKFQELPIMERRVVLLFYNTKGDFRLTLKEMAAKLDCAIQGPVRLRRSLIKQGYLKVDNYEINTDGAFGKKLPKSYTYLTPEGREWIMGLLEDFTKN